MERISMKKTAKIPLFLSCILILGGCSSRDKKEIYIGQMEADTVVLSAKIPGELIELSFVEGDPVQEGEILGRIDTEDWEIRKRQQNARIEELNSRKSSALLQIDQAQVQLSLDRDTLRKTEKLLTQGGATEQRRDELSAKVRVGESNLQILRSNYQSILAQEKELRADLELTDLSISRASVVSPLRGTILNRFHRAGELADKGTPLYELVDLSTLDLYIYLPLRKLPDVKIGQEAQVSVSGINSPYRGKVVWISPEGEFTPKTILTEETRDTLVYEVKIRVENSAGELKIGMPADVSF
jgi:HlyD family secretion protein